MEKDLKIPISKSVIVYGKFQGPLTRPLFILVHGLPGSYQESFYEKAVLWFGKNGYSTFRFNLYDWRPKARKLIDCTLKDHAGDIDAIVAYFRKRGAKRVYIAGHSYGCPSIFLSKKQDINAIACWDPSYKISFTKKNYGSPAGVYVKDVHAYAMKWGVSVLIGKKMADEADRLNWNMLTQNIRVPIKIISAEKGVLGKGAKIYFEKASEPKGMTVIKGATHYFDDTQHMQEKVYAISKQWFDRFR